MEKGVGTGMRDWEQGKQRIRLGEVPVEKIRLDLKSRDDIPAVLRGLQALYCDPRMRKRLFELLESALGSDRDLGNGRPGMPMWSMVVLAVLKEGLDCDWDRLHELVNRHGTVREMLGDSRFGGQQYYRRTLIDNVSLLTPELLRAVGERVVPIGHEVVRSKAGGGLSARCDSFVVEGGDRRSLSDRYGAVVGCDPGGGAYLLEVGRGTGVGRLASTKTPGPAAATSVSTSVHVPSVEGESARSEGLPVQLSAATAAGCRDHGSIGRVPGGPVRTPPPDVAGNPSGRPDRASGAGGRDPSGLGEDFSVFEEHTRWISKGKAGRPVELGVPLTVIEDQHRFILDYRIMWEGGDVDAAVPLVESCKQRYPELTVRSFDRGFHSPANRSRLERMLEVAALPATGRTLLSRSWTGSLYAPQSRTPTHSNRLRTTQHYPKSSTPKRTERSCNTSYRLEIRGFLPDTKYMIFNHWTLFLQR